MGEVGRYAVAMKLPRGIFKLPSHLTLVAAIVIALCFGLAGCLALAIPEVAYEGYKYEHSKNAKPKATPSMSHQRRHRWRVTDETLE